MRREWIKDLGLTLVVLLAQSGPFLFAQRIDPEPWTFLDYLPVLWACMPVFFRRYQPALCVFISALGVGAYGVISHGPAQPIWYGALVCMYTVAYQSPRIQRLATLAITGLGMLIVIGSINTAIRELATWSAAYALGTLGRTRKEAAITAQAQATQLATERERTRIARDLHDILGHAFSLMVVQAESGAAIARQDPARAEKTFDAISAAGREAMTQLRETVGTLRETPSLSNIDSLVLKLKHAGLVANLVVRGEPRQLPDEVQLAAYRVVQEALTNVVKHARAKKVEVIMDWRPESLEMSIVDDGVGNTESEGGHGLLGIRERVAAVGGRVDVGPCASGAGFKVKTVFA
ncbi:MAG TPA: two-component sensor histidine kinase [Micromonosporaceae bacterium]|nr:two-component sensor histidine kinase [Micromonosporaceae bacterium]